MLNHLVLYGQSTQGLPGQTARWESRDGGRSWEPLAPVAAAPKPTVPMAAIGGISWRSARTAFTERGGARLRCVCTPERAPAGRVASCDCIRPAPRGDHLRKTWNARKR